ncbi:hypothetical protein LS48_01120 [Aequorivita aquimaris]|uniref:RagB/SusD family nutrient uptake outer membrane protein n=1 Tax=Aequorivita aquimaris TaxID=1548749 RepID=A0A137RLM6_9FLAO|nr:RagB/SusD family nutrient uptake outer membrane protein [Aequorivita aquimaris]KXO01106.1 hypothetical protein LS48_01120 [Aequorivita aquimaris]
MKNSYIIKRQEKIIFFLPILLFLFSCDGLEVDTPKHLLTGETVFTDSKTVEAAIISLYANLRDNVLLTGSVRGMSNLMGYYADELEYVSPYGLGDENFYKNNLSANDGTVLEIWNGAYNQIYAANAIVEGVQNAEYFTEEERDLYTGEALFVRSLVHFYLLNLFGDIPYITTTNYVVNKSVSRSPANEVYDHIITDLLQARDLLPLTDSTGEHVRPTKYVASALLARAYLYTKQWTLAQQFATEVIENNGWEPNVENVFIKSSPSTLWQFSPNREGDPTHEGEIFVIPYAPPNERVLSTQIIQAFEEGDLRKENWVGEISDGTQSWYFPYKYKIGIGGNNPQEYSIVFRMAEQYLIRAEATTMLGDMETAKADLNKIRSRADLGNTTAVSQGEMLEAILHERMTELFSEHGHRFFDLKRTGNLDSALSFKPGWESNDRLLPIPEREILLNPNLQPQNEGY